MAPLAEEEENYIRLALLLKGLSPRAVRTYFDSKFPCIDLPSTLNTNKTTLVGLKKNRVLNQVQWNRLFPGHGVPVSTTFDVTLMICLIRNLTTITHPINGFDSLPLAGEITPGADLARIKWYRNILAHHDSDKIDTTFFMIAWANISDALRRLGGQPMNQECQELKVKILDQSNQEIMLEIKQLQEETKELIQTVDSLGKEHSEVSENLKELQDSHSSLRTEHSKVTELLKDPVPLNIRGQIKEVLEAWTEDNKMFLETNGAKIVLKRTKENGCVVVTGSSGTGKSSLVRHVALRMQDEGYDILPVTNPKEIIKWYDPTCPSKKILFVVDDFCGTYTINHMKFENWKNLMEKIKTLIEKKPVKLIMSCRLQVYKDEKMKSLSFYQSCECNLLSKDICLSIKEKYSIAEFYLKTNAYKINTSYYTFDCFPLLCRLCSKNINLSIADFFKSPYTVYKEEIDKLKTEGAHVKYCALALCVIFNNRLKEKWLTKDVDKEIKTIIKNTYEACKVVKGTSRLVIRDELDSLTYTFIRRDGDSYRTIHDKLFDFLAFYFGSVMIQCLIKNASSHFIRERFLFEKNRNSDEYVIIIPKRDLQMYIDRIIDDWSRGNIQDVYCNINMDNPIFRHRFLVCLEGLEISQQKQLASLYDTNNYGTPLIHCCFKGDIDMVTWCLHHCTSNVNQCRESDGASPMFIACQDGHTEIVQMLIKNKANIDKCDDKVVSPLHIACWKGHSVIVQMLIDNEADINNYRSTEKSPLFIACQEGHTEIVQLLINYKADIDKSSFNGLFPLYVACENRHAEVVQMLIDNKADIRKCNDKEASPLYIACEKKHTDIVQILIRNKADINKSTYTGASPLYIACQKGHTEIVQMLINNNADIDNCTYTGSSPLFIACEKRHTEIVQILIKNKADVNRSTYTGASPLYIACQKGHTEIVQMLINSKADLNKCIYNGISPLFIAYQNSHNAVLQMLIHNKSDINKCTDITSLLCMACRNGHTEVVQMLINKKTDINKHTGTEESPLVIACGIGHTDIVQLLINNRADIDKCNYNGASPLFIACQNGYTKIVQMLINLKADINKCTNTKESPLFIACQEGHTEIVQILIYNKTDINKCRDTGESPLFIACQEGHTEVVRLLISNKADINKCRDTGESSLFIAYQEGHTEIVKMLINNKANILKSSRETRKKFEIYFFVRQTHISSTNDS